MNALVSATSINRFTLRSLVRASFIRALFIRSAYTVPALVLGAVGLSSGTPHLQAQARTAQNQAHPAADVRAIGPRRRAAICGAAGQGLAPLSIPLAAPALFCGKP